MKKRRVRIMGLMLGVCMIAGTFVSQIPTHASEENAEFVYEVKSKEGEEETDAPSDLPKAEIPQAEFDAAVMILSKVEAGMKYSVDGGTTWIDIKDTTVDLSNTEIDQQKDIRVIRIGTENVSIDSEIQFMDIVKPEAPSQPETTVTETTITIKTVAGQEYSYKEAADTAEAVWGSASEFKNLKEGTAYEIRTRIAGKGLSLPSDAVSVSLTTKVTTLKAPEGVTASMVDTGTIKVSWKAVTGAGSYTLYRSDDDKKTYHIAAALEGLDFVDTTSNGLVSGKNYYYKVVASKVINGLTYNSPASSVKRGFTRLVTPKLKLQQRNKANILTWTDVPNAQLYRVYRSTKKDSGYTRIAIVSDPAYTDRSFVRDTRYYYKVRATRQVTKTFYSEYSSIRYTKKILKPNIIYTELLGNKMRMTWAKNIYIDGAVVYHKKPGEKYTKAGTYKDGRTRFTSEELSKGTHYFKIRFFKYFDGKRAYGAYGKTQKVVIK